MHHLRVGARAASVSAVILQGFASDREYIFSVAPAEAAAQLALARDYVASGRGRDALPEVANLTYWGRFVSARRFVDVASFGGRDDDWSTDLSDAQLADKLGHIRVPALLLTSLADWYIRPQGAGAVAHANRLAAAMRRCPRAVVLPLPGAPHAPATEPLVRTMVDGVVTFLGALGRPR